MRRRRTAHSEEFKGEIAKMNRQSYSFIHERDASPKLLLSEPSGYTAEVRRVGYCNDCCYFFVKLYSNCFHSGV